MKHRDNGASGVKAEKKPGKLDEGVEQQEAGK